jgi:hypothetical protein
LEKKKKIDWPHYFIERMFDLPNDIKCLAFGYCSTISDILTHFKITDGESIPTKTVEDRQIFSTRTMSGMHYHLDSKSLPIVWVFRTPFGDMVPHDQPFFTQLEEPIHDNEGNNSKNKSKAVDDNM